MSREREIRETEAQLAGLAHRVSGVASSMAQFGQVVAELGASLENACDLLHQLEPEAAALDASDPLRHNHWAMGVYGGCPACFTTWARKAPLDVPRDGG